MSSQIVFKHLLILTLVINGIVLSTGQSPFRSPERITGQFQGNSPRPTQPQDRRSRPRHGGNVIKSPFTPPSHPITRELTTKPAPPVTTTELEVETTPKRNPRPVVPAGSPYTPAPNTEWQAPPKNPVRNHQNPGKRNAPTKRQWNPNPEDKLAEGRRRLRKKGPPGMSIYQNGQYRDIHDVRPGATPWTRYTKRPKPSIEVGGGGSRTASNFQCGSQQYSMRTQICCGGRVLRRQGMQPSCCGIKTFDAVFSKCCNGEVSFRSAGNSDC